MRGLRRPTQVNRGSVPGVVRVGDLEIDQDLAFQRREWTFMRVAWIVLALFLVACAAGIFGGYGPLRTGKATAAGEPLTVEFDRFARYRAPSELRFVFAPRASEHGEVQLALSSDYTSEIVPDSITPQPDQVEASGGRTLYTFKVADPGDELTVLFRIAIARSGIVTGRAGTSAALPISFRHFVYP